MLIYTLPFIAALTGWITNYIAVKMLFHPKEKIKILFFEIQGIFPKRKNKLAEKLGKVVANDLFSVDDIVDTLNTEQSLTAIKNILNDRVDDFLDVKLVEVMPMLKMFMNDDLRNTIKGTLVTEFEGAIPQMIESYSSQIENQIDIEKIVQEKVVNFSSDKLEEILYSIMRKEFRFIEILGGFLGFFIGLIQLLLVHFS